MSLADIEPKPPPQSGDRQTTRFLDWLDVSAKLMGAVAVVLVAFHGETASRAK